MMQPDPAGVNILAEKGKFFLNAYSRTMQEYLPLRSCCHSSTKDSKGRVKYICDRYPELFCIVSRVG